MSFAKKIYIRFNALIPYKVTHVSPKIARPTKFELFGTIISSYSKIMFIYVSPFNHLHVSSNALYKLLIYDS